MVGKLNSVHLSDNFFKSEVNLITKIIILGAGGDGLVVAEAVHQYNESISESKKRIIIHGFLDDAYSNAGAFEGFQVFGQLDYWRFLDEDIFFIPAIQKVGDMPRRLARIEALDIPMERWCSIIHPTAVIASSAQIGYGVYVGAFCSVQPRCFIGDFATLRAGAALGHDAVVSSHAYVGPNAVMCGKSVLQKGSHLGPGAVILDNRVVGQFAVVGIGSSVTKHVRDYAIVTGNPARRIGQVR